MSIAGKFLELITDCPRCGVNKVTFDIFEAAVAPNTYSTDICFCRCRRCSKMTNFVLKYYDISTLSSQNIRNCVVNDLVSNISIDELAISGLTACPDFTPEYIKATFDEAVRCMAVQAWNGSGAMFRKTVDLATRSLVRTDSEHEIGNSDYISWKTFKDLKLRIDWLLRRGEIDRRIEPLIECIREDGNDAAHAFEALDRNTCLDLLDFTTIILETIFTEPGRISESIRRRAERRTT